MAVARTAPANVHTPRVVSRTRLDNELVLPSEATSECDGGNKAVQVIPFVVEEEELEELGVILMLLLLLLPVLPLSLAALKIEPSPQTTWQPLELNSK